MSNRILFVVNVDWFFISHRLVLAEAAIKAGYEVIVACGYTGRQHEISAVGAEVIEFNFERSGTNLHKEFKTLRSFRKLYRKVKPDLIHHITLKPVCYGTIAAKNLGIPVVNAVSGLGYNLSEGKSGFATLIMVALLRLGFRNNHKLKCIFQNHDDLKTMKQRKVIQPSHSISIIKGAGVDLDVFCFTELPATSPIKVILPARLLWDKGVKEFAEAAKILEQDYKEAVVFSFVGMLDADNKAGASQSDLDQWLIKDYLTWMPYQQDMVEVYQNADIVVLPSYREGMPKTLLEACAIGRPIVTTNAIGCRECVDEDINGYKVEIANSEQLAQGIKKLIDSKELRTQFGLNGRKKAEQEFNVKHVIQKHLELYKECLT